MSDEREYAFIMLCHCRFALVPAIGLNGEVMCDACKAPITIRRMVRWDFAEFSIGPVASGNLGPRLSRVEAQKFNPPELSS